jgi:hypothetical protein
MDNPINFSLSVGAVTFVLSALILIKLKPSAVMKINSSNEHVLDQFRLVVMSIMIAVTVVICVFLGLYKGDVVVEGVKMTTSAIRMNPGALSY